MYRLRWLCSLVVLAAGLALQAAPATAERRVALVIGNSAYEHTSPLPNPRNDAEDLAAALRRLEFEVIVGLDLNKREMEGMIQEFTGKLVGVDVALFFYAGHSLQVGRQNFLMPVDARLAREAAVDFETIPLILVLRHMQAEAKTNLVFLDACRDNPLARTLGRSVPTRSSYFGRGLAQVEAGGIGTLIGFSTQPDNVALDGQGRNSPYAAALLKHMEAAGIDVGMVMMRVRNDVLEATQRQQVPWEHSSLTKPFQFKRGAVASPTPPPPATPPTAPSEQASAWSTLKDSSSIPMLEAFLRRYPSGIYADLARARLEELKQMRLAREREQLAREASDARDREARDRERAAREKEAKEARDREDREARELREKELRGREARELREREAREQRETREREARQREARESESRDKVALAQPPLPPRSGSLSNSDAVSRITAWIERDFLTDKVAYSPMVDWYDQGTISRETVLKEQAKYFVRWPERQFALIPGTLQITAIGPNRYAATFELTYVVRSAARNAQGSGKSRIMIDVEVIDGLPHVTRQRETKGR